MKNIFKLLAIALSLSAPQLLRASNKILQDFNENPINPSQISATHYVGGAVFIRIRPSQASYDCSMKRIRHGKNILPECFESIHPNKEDHSGGYRRKIDCKVMDADLRACGFDHRGNKLNK